MSRKLAIDWSENELRLVAAQCSGGSVKVTDAAVIPIAGTSVVQALQAAISLYGLQKADTLVAIGRGKAELRELQLPPVPDEELPDMVRFQAIRSFASAGDSATVDYLLTNRSDHGVEMIAAAVNPSKLDEIKQTCEAAELVATRIALRPLAAASLFLTRSRDRSRGAEIVLIDLLEDDAEIVVARGGHVVFVRTVRMPSDVAARRTALVAELRRSLVACGSTGSPQKILLWGLQSVHQADVDTIAESIGGEVDVIDPFSLVDVDRRMQGKIPERVGRLAPLVGLLASDETNSDRLIDFLNPRRRVEEPTHRRRTALLIGIPVAAALLMAFFGYRYVKALDQQIEDLVAGNAAMREPVKAAVRSVDRTEAVDKFLDGDANWLDEITRIAESIPPADELILRSLVASTDSRSGVSTLTITGAAIDPDVIDRLEEAIRDENHRVLGDQVSEQETSDAYRWAFTDKISVLPEYVRSVRYEAMARQPDSEIETDPTAPDKDTKEDTEPEPQPAAEDEAEAQS